MPENGQFEAIPFNCFSVEGTKINKNHQLLPVKINIYYQQAFFKIQTSLLPKQCLVQNLSSLNESCMLTSMRNNVFQNKNVSPLLKIEFPQTLMSVSKTLWKLGRKIYAKKMLYLSRKLY